MFTNKEKKLAPVLVSSEFKIVPASLELVNPTSACSGLLVAVSGKFFGQQKPKIIIQQVDKVSMKTTKKPCVIYSPSAYPDEKGAPGKSCMDLKTGDSRIKFYVPGKLPDLQSVLWLDNKTGRDFSPFAPSYRISGKILRILISKLKSSNHLSKISKR